MTIHGSLETFYRGSLIIIEETPWKINIPMELLANDLDCILCGTFLESEKEYVAQLRISIFYFKLESPGSM